MYCSSQKKNKNKKENHFFTSISSVFLNYQQGTGERRKLSQSQEQSYELGSFAAWL